MTHSNNSSLADHRTRRWGKNLLKLLAGLVIIMAIALVIAHWGVNHPNESTALREWMRHTRYTWLAWRVAIYSTLGWAWWKIWHTSGCKPQYKAPLRRMAIVSTLFILLCEYALFDDGGMPA